MRLPRRSAFAVAAVALTAAAATTGAEATFSDCDPNRSCLWGNNDYIWMLSERAAGGGLQSFNGQDRNNQMDSWGNRTSTNSAGYDSTSGTGDCQTFKFGSNDNNVAFNNSDEVSSWRTNRGC
jgi:peptidase inhibitor family I36